MSRGLTAWLLLALLVPGLAAAAPSYYGWGAGAFLQGPEAGGGDVTPPTVLTSAIASNGDDLTVNFDESVSQGAGYADTDFTLTCSGGAVTLTYSSGDTTASHVYTASRTIQGSPVAETCTLAHDGSANSIEDAAGNDLASFSGQVVSNGSTQDTIVPTFSSARISGSTLTVTYSEAMSAGAGGTGGHAIASCSGGAVTPTYSSGAGSSQLTFSLSREPDPSETGCVLGYTQPTNGWEDAAGNDLATYSGQATTIRSACVELIGPVISPVVGPSVLALQCAR